MCLAIIDISFSNRLGQCLKKVTVDFLPNLWFLMAVMFYYVFECQKIQ